MISAWYEYTLTDVAFVVISFYILVALFKNDEFVRKYLSTLNRLSGKDYINNFLKNSTHRFYSFFNSIRSLNLQNDLPAKTYLHNLSFHYKCFENII